MAQADARSGSSHGQVNRIVAKKVGNGPRTFRALEVEYRRQWGRSAQAASVTGNKYLVRQELVPFHRADDAGQRPCQGLGIWALPLHPR